MSSIILAVAVFLIAFMTGRKLKNEEMQNS